MFQCLPSILNRPLQALHLVGLLARGLEPRQKLLTRLPPFHNLPGCEILYIKRSEHLIPLDLIVLAASIQALLTFLRLGQALSPALLGGLLVSSRKIGQAALRYLIALGAGFMLAAVFLKIIPETIEQCSGSALVPMMWLLGGYLLIQFAPSVLV